MLLSACRLMWFCRVFGALDAGSHTEDYRVPFLGLVKITFGMRFAGPFSNSFQEIGVLFIRGYVAIPLGHAPRSNQKSELFFGIDRVLARLPNHECDSNAREREDSNRPNPESDSIHRYSSNETETPGQTPIVANAPDQRRRAAPTAAFGS